MPPSVNNELRDLFLTHSVGLDRLTTGQVNKMGALLVDAERELIHGLTSRLKDISLGKVEGVGTGADTTRAIRRATAESGQILHRYSPGLYAELEQDLAGLAQYEANFVQDRIEQAIPTNVAPFAQIHSVRPEVLNALVTSTPFMGQRLGAYFGDGPKSFSKVVQRKIRKTIERNLAAGVAPAEMVRKMQRQGVNIARRELAAITRTATQHVLNEAAERVYERNAGKNGVLKGVQWLSTLDVRTTLQFCVPRDHAVYDIKTKKGLNARGKRYPWLQGPGRIHWGCRSKGIPVTKSWKELGIKAKELDRRDRASMDGVVARETTAEDWMRAQLSSNAKVKVRIVEGRVVRNGVVVKPGRVRIREITRRRQLERLYGKRKMQAWADGEITLDQMLNASGTRTLTLEELGLLEGVPTRMAVSSGGSAAAAAAGVPKISLATSKEILSLVDTGDAAAWRALIAKHPELRAFSQQSFRKTATMLDDGTGIVFRSLRVGEGSTLVADQVASTSSRLQPVLSIAQISGGGGMEARTIIRQYRIGADSVLVDVRALVQEVKKQQGARLPKKMFGRRGEFQVEDILDGGMREWEIVADLGGKTPYEVALAGSQDQRILGLLMEQGTMSVDDLILAAKRESMYLGAVEDANAMLGFRLDAKLAKRQAQEYLDRFESLVDPKKLRVPGTDPPFHRPAAATYGDLVEGDVLAMGSSRAHITSNVVKGNEARITYELRKADGSISLHEMTQRAGAKTPSPVMPKADLRPSYTPRQMSRAEAVDVIKREIPDNASNGWFRKADISYKRTLTEAVEGSQEARDAALNILHRQAEDLAGRKIPWDEFLDTELTLYRGGKLSATDARNTFQSFSLDRRMAQKFADKVGGKIYEIKLKPSQTFGSMQTIAEAEVLVPTKVAMNAATKAAGAVEQAAVKAGQAAMAAEPLLLLNGQNVTLEALTYRLAHEGWAAKDIYAFFESRGVHSPLKNVYARIKAVKTGKQLEMVTLGADELAALRLEAEAAVKTHWPPLPLGKYKPAVKPPTPPKAPKVVDTRPSTTVVDDMAAVIQKETVKIDALRETRKKVQQAFDQATHKRQLLTDVQISVNDEKGVLERLREKISRRDLDDLRHTRATLEKNKEWYANKIAERLEEARKYGAPSFGSRELELAKENLAKLNRATDLYDDAIKAVTANTPAATEAIVTKVSRSLVQVEKRLAQLEADGNAANKAVRLLEVGPQPYEIAKQIREAENAMRSKVWDELPHAKPRRTGRLPKLMYESSTYEKARREVAQETMEWYRRYFKNFEDFPQPSWAKYRGSRSKQDKLTIFLTKDAPKRTAIHEYGHFFETNQRALLRRSLRWREARTVNEKLRRMKDVVKGSNYDPWEVTKPDKFYDPYVGKHYTDTWTVAGVSSVEHYATEVLSMGLELFYADPARLLREDKEMFLYVVRVLRGE